jgi:hypothetical protein
MNCKNCQTHLSEEADYCYTCGGKVIRNRLTIKNLFEDFSSTFLNYDNKFFQTFITLFKKPEDVIGGYIDGTRKKYVNVVSYFMIALTITGLEWFILKKYFPEAIDLSDITNQKGNKIANDTMSIIVDNISIVMMLFVPMYALMSRIVFFNIQKYNYTEHLVIFMYALSQITIVGALLNVFGATTGISLGELTYINFPFQIIFSAYCLKRLYSLSLKGIILRTLLFFVVLLVFYITAIIMFIAIMYLVQGPDFFKEMIEAQKATQGI